MSIGEKFLRLPEVVSRTGYSGTTIWRKVKTGEFPKPVSIGPKATAWIEREVDEWITSKIEHRASAPKASIAHRRIRPPDGGAAADLAGSLRAFISASEIALAASRRLLTHAEQRN